LLQKVEAGDICNSIWLVEPTPGRKGAGGYFRNSNLVRLSNSNRSWGANSRKEQLVGLL
jgi:hypothetical protein